MTTLRIARFAVPVLLLLGSAAIAEPPSRGLGRSCDAPHRELFGRQFSGVTEARLEVLEDEAAWCDLWDEAHAILFPRPACDPSVVDFDREVVLVAALGPRPDTCHAVGIPCVQALGASGHVRAHVREVVPGPSCGCGAAVVHPVVAVAIERPIGRVQWRQRVAELDCD